MRSSGLPDTIDEATRIATDVAATNFNRHLPPHYPHSQIVALSTLVLDLTERVKKLETKRKPGRPPKPRAAPDVERIRAELNS